MKKENSMFLDISVYICLAIFIACVSSLLWFMGNFESFIEKRGASSVFHAPIIYVLVVYLFCQTIALTTLFFARVLSLNLDAEEENTTDKNETFVRTKKLLKVTLWSSLLALLLMAIYTLTYIFFVAIW